VPRRSLKQRSPGAGVHNAVMYRARAFREAALPRISRERHGDVRARARGPKRATDDNTRVIGRSDPSDTQGSGAHSRGTRRAECGDSQPLSEQTCIPRDGRDVRGPTCTRGSPGATVAAAPGRPAKRRDGVRAFVGAELVRHGGAPGHPAGREATRLARGAPRSSWSCAPRDRSRGLAREPRRGVRAGATRAWPSCRRRTRRAREVRRGAYRLEVFRASSVSSRKAARVEHAPTTSRACRPSAPAVRVRPWPVP